MHGSRACLVALYVLIRIVPWRWGANAEWGGPVYLLYWRVTGALVASGRERAWEPRTGAGCGLWVSAECRRRRVIAHGSADGGGDAKVAGLGDAARARGRGRRTDATVPPVP